MKLSAKERRKIYEEEKARIEARQKRQTAQGSSTTQLEPNVAGLLCYLAGWISGIIFLVLEQKNKLIRFHAMQSIVTFGFLTIASILLNALPLVGNFLAVAVGILIFILWTILMVKAYQGELYKLPVAGNIAEGILPDFRSGRKQETAKEAAESAETTRATKAKKAEVVVERADDYSRGARAGRVAGYSFAIFWNLVLLVFFSFFHRYIAWYHVQPDGSVIGLPLLTDAYFAWLPFLITALLLSIAAYIILIIYDKYWLRGIIQIILNIIGAAVTVNLVVIFPFDFSVIPNNTAAYAAPIVVTIVLILIAVGLVIAALVHLIKLIVSLSSKSSS
jgi:uncharacterized membrane protein